MKSFIFRWLFSTNHKDKGTLYFFFGTFAGIIGTLGSLLIRLEFLASSDSMLNGNFQYYDVFATTPALPLNNNSLVFKFLKVRYNEEVHKITYELFQLNCLERSLRDIC
jgi:hypothetical protein